MLNIFYYKYFILGEDYPTGFYIYCIRWNSVTKYESYQILRVLKCQNAYSLLVKAVQFTVLEIRRK